MEEEEKIKELEKLTRPNIKTPIKNYKQKN